MTIRNVYIFTADALRDDHLPDDVKHAGEYISTIAAGTNSPASFSSIVSGLYPDQHQTHAFTHRLDPQFNYLNSVSDKFDTHFFQVYETELATVLGIEQTIENPIRRLEEPFFVLERDMTTHAPYDHPNYEKTNIDDPQEYFGGKNVDWRRIRDDYRTASEHVGERFHRRLDELNDAGMLDDTLVVFSSDHGELLGEYGEMSHGEPLVPELVHVPTVIRHPEGIEPEVDVMSHVDILPTMTDVLDESDPWRLPGKSAYRENQVEMKICERRSKPHTLEQFSFQNLYEYNVRSVWDADGGYALNKTSLRGLGVHAFRQTPLFNPLRGADSLRAFQALYEHLKTVRKFDHPGFSQSEAQRYLSEMDEFSVQLNRTLEDISEEAKEELERLGYL
jgi:arylsulfatase A-like enzyme